MLPRGWERRAEFEPSHLVRAFGRSSAASEPGEALAELANPSAPEIVDGARIVALDLRGGDLHCPSVAKKLANLAGRWAPRQLVVLADRPTELAGIPAKVFQHPHDLLRWIVAQNLMPRPGAAVPLFDFSDAELEQLRREGLPLGEVVEGLAAELRTPA